MDQATDLLYQNPVNHITEGEFVTFNSQTTAYQITVES